MQVKGTTLTYLVREEPSTDGKVRFVAWFPSIPNLRVQAEDELSAVSELQATLPDYLNALRAVGGVGRSPTTDLSRSNWPFAFAIAGLRTA